MSGEREFQQKFTPQHINKFLSEVWKEYYFYTSRIIINIIKHTKLVSIQPPEEDYCLSAMIKCINKNIKDIENMYKKKSAHTPIEYTIIYDKIDIIRSTRELIRYVKIHIVTYTCKSLNKSLVDISQ